jgi:hypothetical protein
MFPDLNHTDWFYRSKHWMRDGGLRYLFDSFFFAIVCGAVSSFLAIGLGFSVARIITNAPQPKHHQVVIDHKKDGTSKPRIFYTAIPNQRR